MYVQDNTHYPRFLEGETPAFWYMRLAPYTDAEWPNSVADDAVGSVLRSEAVRRKNRGIHTCPSYDKIGGYYGRNKGAYGYNAEGSTFV